MLQLLIHIFRKLALKKVNTFLHVFLEVNGLFARSGHMVRNKLRWDANDAVGLSKQRKVGLDWYEFLCFESPTVLFASHHNVFRTM